MSDSLTNTELRDKITQLVFEWHHEVEKMPRGKTISFWKDKEVMALISQYVQDTVAKARVEEVERFGTEWGNNPKTPHWYAWEDYIEDRLNELKPQQKDEEL